MSFAEVKKMADAGDGRLLVITWPGVTHGEYTTAKRIVGDVTLGFYTAEHFDRVAKVEVV